MPIGNDRILASYCIFATCQLKYENSSRENPGIFAIRRTLLPVLTNAFTLDAFTGHKGIIKNAVVHCDSGKAQDETNKPVNWSFSYENHSYLTYLDSFYNTCNKRNL